MNEFSIEIVESLARQASDKIEKYKKQNALLASLCCLFAGMFLLTLSILLRVCL